ncbi:beta-lactamase [Xylaria nigripes]|nr:beta-lactamase [Xylaria nigripes]
MAKVHGKCTPQFEKVRALFEKFVDSGDEFGASIAVNVNGEDVVNLWGGYANADTKEPWVENTIVVMASSSKCVSSLAMLLLVESGAVSVYDKVCKFWPEFAANGKENIEIRHLLSHTSGVPGWDDKVTIEEVCDPVTSSAKLASQAPWLEPGTASAYHYWNFGHMLGEVIRNVTGLSLKQFIAQKIAAPLGADFQLGVVEKDLPRVAHLAFSASPDPIPDSKSVPFFMKVVRNPEINLDVAMNPAWQQGEIGASNGYSNARAMNKILSNITLAGSKGVGLLSKSTVDLIFKEQSQGLDLSIGKPIRFGIGYALRGDGDLVSKWMPAGDIAYWGGAGGSLGLMDVGRKVTITYAMNKGVLTANIGNEAVKAYVGAIYEALGVKI